MTDHDRGAYAPHDDEPLSFDARRPSERRPVPMTLIGSAIVLVALIGGVALVYRGGVRHAGEGPRPVGEPVMSVKTAAPPPMREETREPSVTQSTTTSTETTTSASSGVANGQATRQAAPAPSGPAPTFAAAPEQPAPRPAPQSHSLALLAKPPVATVRRPAPPVVAASPISGAPDDIEVAAAGTTTRREAAPMKLADATPSRRPTRDRSSTANDAADNLAMARLVARSTTADAIRSSATRSAEIRSAETRLAPTPGGAVVQIGAFSSAALAAEGYAEVASDMSGRMSGKAKHVLPLEVNGKTLYRTWLSGFASRSDAVAFCETLRTKNKSCIVKG